MTAQSTLQISKQPEYDGIYEFDSLIAVLKNMPKMAYSRDLPTGCDSKSGRSYLQAFEAFILISESLHIFYLIALGLTILEWGEPSL